MFKLILDRYTRCLAVLLTGLLVLMLIPVTLQIASRMTGFIPRYIWTEEVARFCFVWIIMIGATVAVRDGTHFDVDLLPRPQGVREQHLADLVVHAAMMLFALVFTWYGVRFAIYGAGQYSEMSGINLAAMYAAFPFAGGSWSLFLLEKIIEDLAGLRVPEVDKPA